MATKPATIPIKIIRPDFSGILVPMNKFLQLCYEAFARLIFVGFRKKFSGFLKLFKMTAKFFKPMKKLGLADSGKCFY